MELWQEEFRPEKASGCWVPVHTGEMVIKGCVKEFEARRCGNPTYKEVEGLPYCELHYYTTYIGFNFKELGDYERLEPFRKMMEQADSYQP